MRRLIEAQSIEYNQSVGERVRSAMDRHFRKPNLRSDDGGILANVLVFGVAGSLMVGGVFVFAAGGFVLPFVGVGVGIGAIVGAATGLGVTMDESS